jgi:hypothetical protein
MTYEAILERQPKSTDTGDRRAAKAYLDFLESVVFADAGLLAGLTVSNRNYLYKQRKLWAKRAAGDDERWNQCGSRPGRPAVDKPRQVSLRVRGQFDPEKEERSYDDLSLRIIARFRNIRPEREDL